MESGVLSDEEANDYFDLTSRELELVLLICDGFTTRQIADQLSISPKTVEYHRTKIYVKNRVDSIATLVRKAIRAGMIVALLPQLWRQSELTVALNRVGARAIISIGRIELNVLHPDAGPRLGDFFHRGHFAAGTHKTPAAHEWRDGDVERAAGLGMKLPRVLQQGEQFRRHAYGFVRGAGI